MLKEKLEQTEPEKSVSSEEIDFQKWEEILEEYDYYPVGFIIWIRKIMDKIEKKLRTKT